MRRVVLAVAACAALLLPAAASAAPPPIKHVFVIVLENKGFNTTFGPNSQAPYLSKQLTSQGALLSQYYGIGHASLDNYVAMVSGQAPNTITQGDCPFYEDFTPGTPAPSDGQFIGQGCVYPAAVKTIADQLSAGGLAWKGYMEGMATPCEHPALNSVDTTQQATPSNEYASRHDPFVYFHSIIDTPSCAQNVVPLTQLSTDLQSSATTPSFSFITPNLCHDGHDSPCADGEPGGLVSADQFLKTWVPAIKASPAWADGSLLAIIFDEADTSDASACCNEQPGFNTPNPGGPTPGPGGGRTGAVLLSQFIHPGTTSSTGYNHYSLLRSIEDIFGQSHLGYAGQAGLSPFGADVFNQH